MYLQNCEIKNIGNGKVKITGPSIFTEKQQKVITKKEHVEKYKKGTPVQEAFPDLTADEREFLVSGIEIGKFDELFK